MKKINLKSLFVISMCVLLMGGLVGCSSSEEGENKKTDKSSTKVEEKVEVGEKIIPENHLKDIPVDSKQESENLPSLSFNSMRNFNAFMIANTNAFTIENVERSEYIKGTYLFFTGEKAKSFIIEHFEDYGYNEEYINQYISNVDMTLDDLCFFLLRGDSMFDDRSQETFKDGEFKDMYMIGFITDNNNALTFEDMTTHEMNSYVSTAQLYK